MYKIRNILCIMFALGCIQSIGCGQTEYTGALKERYQACQFSQGFEYHPEEGQCYCTNGIVCEEGYVCDTSFNDCIRHVHVGGYDCEDPTLKYTYDSVTDEMVMRGECNTNNPICDSDSECIIPDWPVTFECNPNIDECDLDDKDDSLDVCAHDEEGCAPSDPVECNPDGDENNECLVKPGPGKDQLKHFECKTTSTCKDNTITLNFNGKEKDYPCPHGCQNGVCQSINISDKCEGSIMACITNNNQSTQYQCQDNKWVAVQLEEDCLGCDISKEHCINNNVEIRGEMIQYYKEIFINNESTFIPIKNVCSDSDGSTCKNCQIGEQRCIEDHIKLVCNEHGIWERKECCVVGCTKDSTGSVECTKECTENEKKCEENQVFNCVDGIWTKSTSCQYGCNEEGTDCNQNVENCKSGTKQCKDKKLYKCVDNTWNPDSSCEDDCVYLDGVAVCKKCDDGATKCDNKQLYKCDKNEWHSDPSCDENDCIDLEGVAQCKICDKGAKKCEDKQLFKCEKNEWKPSDTCKNGCNPEGTNCVPDISVCKLGSTRCDNDHIFTCENGEWKESKKCANGCNKDGKECN